MSPGATSTLPAPRTSSTSPACAFRIEECHSRVDVRDPRRHAASVRDGVDDELSRHRRVGGLPREVDVGHDHVVGGGQRRAEVGGEVARARDEVRLEEHAQPAPRKRLPRGGDRGRDLGRVVGVVVDDRHASGLGDLEAPPRPGEPAERGRRLRRDRRRRARARRGLRPRCGGCGRRAAPAAPRTAARRERRAAPTPATRSNAASSSASERNSLWWSSSTFVTTAICAGSPKTVRSDSSPSTTSHPSPAPAFDPSWGTGAPISHAGSSPLSRSANAIIAAVVPLPCVPATTIDGRRATSSARSSARRSPATCG